MTIPWRQCERNDSEIGYLVSVSDFIADAIVVCVIKVDRKWCRLGFMCDNLRSDTWEKVSKFYLFQAEIRIHTCGYHVKCGEEDIIWLFY